MKVVVVLVCVVGSSIVGYQVGLWWLNRTVESPELESAVYPALGTIAGCLVGLFLGGLFLLLLKRAKDRD